MEFSHHMETTMRPGGTFEAATDWAGKCPGAAARIAGVLHAIEHATRIPWAEEISKETMTRALDIIGVIAVHSLAAFDLMGADEAIAAARRVWDWIKRGRRRTFTEREAFEGCKSGFPKMADLRRALEVLVERGYIEIAESESKGKGLSVELVAHLRREAAGILLALRDEHRHRCFNQEVGEAWEPEEDLPVMTAMEIVP